MTLLPEIVQQVDEMKRWRHDIHMHPESSLLEQRTASKVAELLRSFHFDEVIERVGQTGVVGVLRNGDGPCIGLAAALDGQELQEAGSKDYQSVNSGYMHAIGHDGEVAMLLGAAKCLSETKKFRGEIVFIFYSSFGGGIGARAMIEDGLFEQYPISEIYAFQSSPELPIGSVSLSAGFCLGASAELLIRIIGQEGLAAFPNKAKNPILVLSEIVNSLETLASSTLDPANPLLICVTSVIAGESFNSIPREAELKGTVRFFNPEFEKWLPTRIDSIVSKIAESYDVRSIVSYRMVSPPIINSAEHVRFVREIARDLLGAEKVEEGQAMALLGSDLGYFLKEKPGVCIPIGNGDHGDLMTPKYNFNDKVLPIGASLFVEIVQNRLSKG